MELVKRFTRQLCEALGFLHQKGMAHRDIKCANVFLTSSDECADIKLGDFGALKETGCASLVGGLKGTPHWMAPEVIRGGPPAPSDESGAGGESWWFRADVWSLGCATLEMLTGHAPWRQYSNPHTAMYQIVVSNNTPAIPADASDEVSLYFFSKGLLRSTVPDNVRSTGVRQRRFCIDACNAIRSREQQSPSCCGIHFCVNLGARAKTTSPAMLTIQSLSCHQQQEVRTAHLRFQMSEHQRQNGQNIDEPKILISSKHLLL